MEHVFEVSGMTCGHCERAVTNALHEVDAAAQIQIDRGQNKVVVQSQATREALRHAISEEGYQVAA
ncbi:heavy-metal-associated domain-containing protein [Comamonas sp. GB3 AK4-5]|uniref:heavy-metal-associated domain-containing protein n=1 Tax=Comamonas sp. GB3 AK4-5 TaxID=3231487 RepID=UPI00351EE88E